MGEGWIEKGKETERKKKREKENVAEGRGKKEMGK